jgi:nucleoporin POM152
LPDKTKYAEEKAIDSAQETGILHMVSQPGHHRYTVLAVKDAHYDFDSKSLQAAKGLFSIEQEVFGKPTAGFRPSPRLSYCVGQPFKASTENTAVIEFVGQGPFEVDLALGPTVAQPIYKKTVSNIKGNTWKVDLPDHSFSHVGSQTLWIASVRDASGCPMEIANDERLYLPVDVLETSTITAVSDRDDYCVGDMLEFVLGGMYLTELRCSSC